MTSHAQAVLAAHSKSFALAGRLLPRAMRADAAVLYAWCRRADDAIDLRGAEDRAGRLARLRAELAAIYAGEAQADPLLAAFQGVVSRRGIPARYPELLLEGLEMDLGPVRLATLADLIAYAYRVAGVVGLMMCHVLGAREEGAHRHAVHLGIAMQITNVCRDVLEDWERGRLYVPGELLERHGVVPGNPIDTALRGQLARAIEQLLRLADRYYRSADLGLAVLSPRAAFAIRTARLVYSAIGDELAKIDYDIFRGRVFVPRWRKVWLACRAFGQEIVARASIGTGGECRESH
jgi:phytoene synthase